MRFIRDVSAPAGRLVIGCCFVVVTWSYSLVVTAATGRQHNAALGTQTFDPRYGFTADDSLVETAKGISAMGSDILKISINPDKYGLESIPNVDTLAELADQHPSFRQVLDMPFKHYHLWSYTSVGTGWRRRSGAEPGLSVTEAADEYQQIYDLAKHLRQTYTGAGKTFHLGHWEGDWHLIGSFEPLQNPQDWQVQGMIDWLNVRQQAIDDAKADTPLSDVSVFQYTEVNLVDKAMNDLDPNDAVRTLTNDVLPSVNVDYVSYSAWDVLTYPMPLSQIDPELTAALDYVESKLPAKSGLPPGKRVWVGEFGYPLEKMGTPELQEQYARRAARAGLEWGAAFILYWEFYNNEIDGDGNQRGFWMIDDQGVEQPVYDTFERYYNQTDQFVADFEMANEILPGDTQFRQFAAPALDDFTLRLGDMNRDGYLNHHDVDPFMQAVQDDQLIPGDLWRADINVDGVVDSWDVDPFFRLVPEPSSVLMLIFTGMVLTRRRYPH